jgi:hypothetical protein
LAQVSHRNVYHDRGSVPASLFVACPALNLEAVHNDSDFDI